MVRVRNGTGRAAVRFRVGVVTDLLVEPDGLRADYEPGGLWADHHTTGELGHLTGEGGFSPVFVYPEDGLEIDCEIVPGEETLLRSRDDNWRGEWRHTLHGKLVQAGDLNRAHRITRRDAHGSVWGILDEWDVLFIVRDAVRE